MRSPILLLAVALLLVACGGSDPDAPGGPSAADASFISIGTGGTTGVYYPVGGAVAQLVNQGTDRHGIRASHESTGGSVYNIKAVLAGDLEFGLAQADRQYHAVQGLVDWEGEPQDDLRAVCSFHPEVVTLVADAAINDLRDLPGKRINLGNAGSGQLQNALDVLQALGIDPDSDIQAERLRAAEAPRMLQDGRIDAFFYTVGHPAGAITETTSGKRQVRLLDIVGVEDLLARSPYYSVATIPAGTYPQAVDGDRETTSIGMLTTLVSSAAVDEEVVYQVTRAVFEQLDTLRTLHPALTGLTPEGMVDGLSAPLHPGARRYYDEAGIAVE